MVAQTPCAKERVHRGNQGGPARPQGPPKLALHGTREVKRLNLSRVHCFVYYTIDEEAGVVEIVALWGQEMAHQPDFVDED